MILYNLTIKNGCPMAISLKNSTEIVYRVFFVCEKKNAPIKEKT